MNGSMNQTQEISQVYTTQKTQKISKPLINASKSILSNSTSSSNMKNSEGQPSPQFIQNSNNVSPGHDFEFRLDEMEGRKLSHTEVMHDRFQKYVSQLPMCDQHLVHLTRELTSLQSMSSENNQQIYQQLLLQEAQQKQNNYLKDASPSKDNENLFSSKTRDQAVARIIGICIKRDYKLETLIMSI